MRWSGPAAQNRFTPRDAHDTRCLIPAANTVWWWHMASGCGARFRYGRPHKAHACENSWKASQEEAFSSCAATMTLGARCLAPETDTRRKMLAMTPRSNVNAETLCRSSREHCSAPVRVRCRSFRAKRESQRTTCTMHQEISCDNSLAAD